MPLGKCIDAVDGTVVFPELFLGDGDLLFGDWIENVEVPVLFLCICHVPLLGVRAKRRHSGMQRLRHAGRNQNASPF